MSYRWKKADIDWLVENSFMFTLDELRDVLGRTPSAVRNKCLELGAAYLKTKKIMSEQDRVDILHLAADKQMCTHQIADKLGWHKTSVCRVLKRGGVTAPSCTCKRDSIKRMRAARMAGIHGDPTVKELALRWGLSVTAARDYAKKIGAVLTSRNRPWQPEEDAFIVKSFALGLPYLVQNLDRTAAAIQNRCWEKGLYIKVSSATKLRGVTNLLKEAKCSRRMFIRAVDALGIPYEVGEYHKRGAHRFSPVEYDRIVTHIQEARS